MKESPHVVCPICKKRVYMTALIDSGKLGDPDWPEFWGEPGDRYIVCRKGRWTHFRTGTRHKLVYMRG